MNIDEAISNEKMQSIKLINSILSKVEKDQMSLLSAILACISTSSTLASESGMSKEEYLDYCAQAINSSKDLDKVELH